MIEIDNKVYRNIPEQVGKNKDDIELLKKAYGYHGPFASKEDIVSPVDQALYLIGTTYPYEIYQYKELTDTYLDLGPFAAAGAQGPAGPQGPQGPQGIPGEDGKSVDAYTKEETDTLLNNRFGRFELVTDEDDYKSRITLNGDDDVFNDYGEFVNNGYTFGNLDHNVELVGESERPYYRNDSTVESVKEIALLKDVNTKANASDVYTKTESDTLLDNKADKSTTYTKNTVDALFNKRFWNWKFTNDSSTNQGGLYHGEDTIISNNYDNFSGYTIGDWNNDYLLTGMSDRPKYSNSDEIKEIALLEDVNTKANKSDVYTKTETDALLNSKYDVKVFTIEKGSIGDEIGTSEFFDYLITSGFNPSQYLNKICRFSYVDSIDYQYEYLVIPTYYDASSSYSDLTIISDGGVYKAYIDEEGHEIKPYIDEDYLYAYCGNLNDLQTKHGYDLVSAINEVNTIAKESAVTASNLKSALYGYVLDTADVDINRDIPSTVDVGGVTYDLADKVKASFNILGGGSTFAPENSLSIPDVAETTVSGVTYSIKDGIIRINGTATGIREIRIVTLDYYGTYYFQPFMSGTITPNSSGATGGIRIIPNGGGSAPGYNQAGACVKAKALSITFTEGATYNNVTFRPALVYGTNPPSIRLDDLAYIKVYDRNNKIKMMLKDELTALNSYLLANYSQYGQHLTGYSINDSVYNYIDFAKKKFIINCAERSYQAGDEADPNVFTDLTKSVYKLETPIEVNISSIIKDDSGITPPLELGGRITAVSSIGMEINCPKNIEMVYKMIKESV